MLICGEAQDCLAGTKSILQTKTDKTLPSDKTHDSANLRASLKERGTQAIPPNECSRKHKFRFSES